MFIIFQREKVHFKNLIQYFHANYSLSGIVFTFQDFKMNLVNISTRGRLGSGGSYPLLKIILKKEMSIIIANKQAQKYLFINQFPKEAIESQLGKHQIVFISKDKGLIDKFQKKLNSNPRQFEFLFDRPFSHIKMESEWQINSMFMPKKEWILSYVGLDPLLYEHPDLLENSLQSLILLLS